MILTGRNAEFLQYVLPYLFNELIKTDPSRRRGWKIKERV